MPEKPTLYTEDIFEDHLKKFQQTKLSKDLEKDFTPKPYHIKYKLLYESARIGMTTLNVVSAATASVLVYFFTYSLTGTIWVALPCSVVFIVLMELVKRKSSDILFRDYQLYRKVRYDMLILWAFFMAISIIFSYFGVKQAVVKYSPPPATVVAEAQEEIKGLDIAILEKEAKLKTYKTDPKFKTGGEILYNINQYTIPELEKTIASLESRRLIVASRINDQNEVIASEHVVETRMTAESAGLAVFLLEFLFGICARYKQVYRYKSYAQFAKSNEVKPESKIILNPTPKSVSDSQRPSSAPSQAKSQTLKTKEFSASKPVSKSNTIILDASNLKKNIRNWWTASNASALEETRLHNLDKYRQGKEALEAMNYEVEEVSTSSLSITPKA